MGRGVEGHAFGEQVGSDFHQWLFPHGCNRALNSLLAEEVVGNGWGLLEVRPLPMTLEDLFVRLVRSDRESGT